MENRELMLRLGLALAIGFIVGLERGWKERAEAEGQRAAGLRTFSLVGLLGGVTGVMSLDGDRLLLTAGLIVTGGAVGIFMWRESEREGDFSATSLVAALLVFMLGALAVLGDMVVAAGAGVATTVLLAHKAALHGWLARLTWEELRSGLLLAAMTFIALPLLPDRTIDPWQAVNPHDLWLMTILIAAVSFAGYAAVKIAGPERGLLLAATLGGLFASTAVTLSLARLARRDGGRLRLISGSILAAGSVMLLRVLAITGLINPALALGLAPVLAAAAASQAAASAALIVTGRPGRGAAAGGANLDHRNPFDLPEVLRFGAILAVVILTSHFALRYFGERGLLTIAAFSGLADVDALTLSAAQMAGAAPAAVHAILVAVGVNTLAKTAYAWNAGGRRLGLILLAVNALTIAVAVLALNLLDLTATSPA
jgi:uncharacterized membrane protein (DUF4010 family)